MIGRNKMQKKITATFLIAVLLFSFFSFLSFGNCEEFSWYIKRNGNKRPLLQKGQEIINEYNAFYIDNKVSDESEEKIIYITIKQFCQFG